MRLLDLFCGAGGAGMGYHRAGFDQIVGVDIRPQPHYPFEFVQGDALEYVREHGRESDLIHASPPCQAYSRTRSLTTRAHPDLVAATRDALDAAGRPYVIENVEGAPLRSWVMLCGTMFGLGVRRHRLFECSPAIIASPASCRHYGRSACSSTARRRGITRQARLSDGFQYVTVVGADFNADEGRAAMGIPWMTRDELSQAIPPAYTEWIGQQMIERMGVGA